MSIRLHAIGHRRRRLLILFVCAAICLTASPSPAAAQQPLTAHSAAAFFDAVMPEQLVAYHIPGAAVAVVKDGRLLFTSGYGVDDLESGRPVSPQRTIFDLASIAKLFTWTVVMQLVESGQLDLDTDVNAYLTAFQIPDSYEQPITLAHLMAHTAGFEYDAAFATADGEEVAPADALKRYLADHMPARIYPPGEVIAYSNYGTALAGYIAARAAGLSFESLVGRRIFHPLGMNDSTFEQPLPAYLAPDLAKGYRYNEGEYQYRPYDYFFTAPASALHSTTADMAKFMIAYLQDGRLGEKRILSESSARRMHSPLYAVVPGHGSAHGFWQDRINGHPILYHPGDSSLAHSQLTLLPEQNVGIFAAYTGDGGSAAKSQLLYDFIDAFFPAEELPPPAAVPADGLLRQLSGSYLRARHPATSWQKMQLLFTVQTLRPDGGDGLIASSLISAPERYSYQSGDTYFRQAGKEQLIFQRDDAGRPVSAFFTREPSAIYFRMPWFQSPGFQLGLLLLFLAGLLYTFLSWVTGGWRDRLRRRPRPVARTMAGWAALFNLLFLLALVVGIIDLLGDTRQLAYAGMPAAIRVGLAFPLLALPFTARLVLAAVHELRARAWSRRIIAHYVLINLALWGFPLYLSYWNFLGWQF